MDVLVYYDRDIPVTKTVRYRAMRNILEILG